MLLGWSCQLSFEGACNRFWKLVASEGFGRLTLLRVLERGLSRRCWKVGPSRWFWTPPEGLESPTSKPTENTAANMEPNMGPNTTTQHGPNMDPACSQHGPNMDQTWTQEIWDLTWPPRGGDLGAQGGGLGDVGCPPYPGEQLGDLGRHPDLQKYNWEILGATQTTRKRYHIWGATWPQE